MYDPRDIVPGKQPCGCLIDVFASYWGLSPKTMNEDYLQVIACPRHPTLPDFIADIEKSKADYAEFLKNLPDT